MEPLISILIPAFNAQAWIADTLQSALDQTWQRKEIIVVDDGSSDRTLAIAKQAESRTVKVVTQPNSGAAAARNKAMSLCQGDYIQWLDADDLLAPDKIARQVKALDGGASKRTLLSSAWGRFIYRPRKAKFEPTALWCDLPPLEWLLRKMEQGIFMQTATWLVSRELTKAAGPWDTRLLGDDDGEYFSRAIVASDGIRFVPEAKVLYRLTGTGSLSYVGRSNKKIDAHFLALELQISYVRRLDDRERVRAACVKYLQRYLPYAYDERLDIVERVQQLAHDLEGHLETPRMSWKYGWIQRLFGWTVAKEAQIYYNRIKSTILSGYDHALLQLGF